MNRDSRIILSELLVIRFRKGENDAFGELVRLWESRLFYFLRRFTDSEQDAWDLLQQTWVKVLKGIPSLKDTSTATAWLYRVARNTALDFLRRRDADLDSYNTLTDEVLANGESDDLRFENAELVHRGLEKLSLAHREVLTLFFLEEFSIDEVAGILGLPTGTVKSRLHYARKAMKSILEREGAADG